MHACVRAQTIPNLEVLQGDSAGGYVCNVSWSCKGTTSQQHSYRLQMNSSGGADADNWVKIWQGGQMQCCVSLQRDWLVRASALNKSVPHSLF